MMSGSDQSETTSLTQSWPTTPKRSVPLYYVQSPSTQDDENHEMDKSSYQGGTTTPGGSMDSPMGSRSSSVTSRVSSTPRVKGFGRNRHARESREWRVILEEDEEGGGRDEPMRRSHVCALALIAVVGVFSLFCFVMRVATNTRHFAPHVSVQKLIVKEFYSGQGIDMRGVPTKLLTLDCTVQIRVQNPASFFGIHISSASFNLLYYDLILASGQIEYYQARKSWGDVSVEIQGSNFPLYGASSGFETGYRSRKVPLKLEFEVQSRGDVVGKLVKSKHRLTGSCSFTIDPNNPKSFGFQEDSCTYH